MTNLTTDCKALNWLIEKSNFGPEELTQEDIEDGSLAYWVGSFNGNLPYRMAQEIKRFSANNKSYPNRGNITHYLISEVVGNIAKSARFTYSFGTTRKTANRINFVIDYEEFSNPTQEEIDSLTGLVTI